MHVVVGHLIIADGERDRFVAASQSAVVQARELDACSHFVVAADPFDPNRVNVAEVWASMDALDSFRQGGPSDALLELIVAAEVAEYEVVDGIHD